MCPFRWCRRSQVGGALDNPGRAHRPCQRGSHEHVRSHVDARAEANQGAGQVRHPRVRLCAESAVVPRLDAWLIQLFDSARLDERRGLGLRARWMAVGTNSATGRFQPAPITRNALQVRSVLVDEVHGLSSTLGTGSATTPANNVGGRCPSGSAPPASDPTAWRSRTRPSSNSPLGRGRFLMCITTALLPNDPGVGRASLRRVTAGCIRANGLPSC